MKSCSIHNLDARNGVPKEYDLPVQQFLLQGTGKDGITKCRQCELILKAVRKWNRSWYKTHSRTTSDDEPLKVEHLGKNWDMVMLPKHVDREVLEEQIHKADNPTPGSLGQKHTQGLPNAVEVIHRRLGVFLSAIE